MTKSWAFEDRLCFRIFVHQVETRLGLREFDLHSDARDQIQRYVTYVAVDPATQLDLLAMFYPVPSRDETFVFSIGGCGVTGQ